jgi:hypothetical protein
MDFKINHIKDEILVIDDIIPLEFQDAIIKQIQGVSHFPWFLLHRIGNPDFFGPGTTPEYVDKNITDEVGFFHMAFDGTSESPYYNFFRHVLDYFSKHTGIQIGKMLRIRLRYTYTSKEHTVSKYSAPHVDFNTGNPYSTLIYYVNDSDGDTIIFDKIFNPAEETYNPIFSEPLPELYRYTPKKGTALFFNGHRWHAGNYPINNSARIVINFDFEVLE